MPIPSFDRFIPPLLNLLAGAPGEVRVVDAYERLAAWAGLTEVERAELLPSGRQQAYKNRILWAQHRLKHAGLSQSPRRGVWSITARGAELAARFPNLPDSEVRQLVAQAEGRASDDDLEPLELAQPWLTAVQALADVATRDTLEIQGVPVELPKTNARGRDRVRDWQRRILPDLIPDSVNADAPERTPFRLLFSLTSAQKTALSIEDAFKGELAPLEGMFRAETTTKQKKMTLAFHVLAVRAAPKSESDAKGYTERTLMLLCRKPDGALDVELLRELIEQFRRPSSDLDLAQRTLLDRLVPGWTPDQEPTFVLPEAALEPEVPFDAKAARLFQEDVRSLLDAALPPADFFQQLNLLLTLHLGLYQARVAALLNPQMEFLYREMASPAPRNREDLDDFLNRYTGDVHPFDDSVACRAPDPERRPVNLQTPARMSFEALSTSLAVFHFNVLLLVQLRRIGETWFAHAWDLLDRWRMGTLDPDIMRALAAKVRGPKELMEEMDADPAFSTFMHRSLEAFAVRFVYNQLNEPEQEDAFKEIQSSPSGLHALRRMYERYNIQNSRNRANSRAYRQGVQTMSSLLRQGPRGLLQGRPRVGPFFEVGAGVLPLLLRVTVGTHEKVPVTRLWKRLSDYGLRFDVDERERLLARLRSMGVYERYSDAGEASYVRNLMTSARPE